jgi:outer membrane lipoprotein-sorting protein
MKARTHIVRVPCRSFVSRRRSSRFLSQGAPAALAMVLGLLVAAPGLRARGPGPTWTLASVLHELDREAKQFRNLTGLVERTKVTVVVNDRSTVTGKIYVRRDGKMRLELAPPDERTILRTGDELYIYNPHIRRVEVYNLAHHREIVDQFLLLGFGTPVHELKKDFLMTLLGERTLDRHKVVLLELTPKAEKVRDQISRIHLWIDEATWLPIQQKFFETGTQDYFVIRYSNVVRNASIDPHLFKPRWPKGTRKVKAEN